MTARLRRVTSTDGVTLAVYEHGDPAAPTIVAVHGYPDNHSVWDGVVELLSDRFHVVTYDVRGAGASDKPSARGGPLARGAQHRGPGARRDAVPRQRVRFGRPSAAPSGVAAGTTSRS